MLVHSHLNGTRDNPMETNVIATENETSENVGLWEIPSAGVFQ